MLVLCIAALIFWLCCLHYAIAIIRHTIEVVVLWSQLRWNIEGVQSLLGSLLLNRQLKGRRLGWALLYEQLRGFNRLIIVYLSDLLIKNNWGAPLFFKFIPKRLPLELHPGIHRHANLIKERQLGDLSITVVMVFKLTADHVCGPVRLLLGAHKIGILLARSEREGELPKVRVLVVFHYNCSISLLE